MSHFTRQAKAYSQYRPTYPEALFAFLAKQAPGHESVWDCATGNGQAAVALANYFDQVVATDVSAPQIEHAKAHPKVDYRVAPAEKIDLPNASVDMVTVAQALHWFDFDAFYAEVKRVLKPNGVIAAWTYALLSVQDKAVQKVIEDFHVNRMWAGQYWPPERAWVDKCYEGIPFDFSRIPVDNFTIERQWDRETVLKYIGTWSSVKCYKERHDNEDPVETFLAPALAAVWPDATTTKTVLFDVPVLLGKG